MFVCYIICHIVLQLWTLKVESGTSVLYAAWLGDTTSNRTGDKIEINGLFAAKQGFKDGQVVRIMFLTVTL